MSRRGRFTGNPGQVNKNAAPIPKIEEKILIRKKICSWGIGRNRFYSRFQRGEFFQEQGFAEGELGAKKGGNHISLSFFGG